MFAFSVVEVINDSDHIIDAEQFYLDVFSGDQSYNMLSVAYDMRPVANNMKGRKWTERKRKSAINMNSKIYEGFISPAGEAIQVRNLSEFMRQNNLNRRTIYKLMRGEISEYRGWTYVS
jgi:hypothetical protein